MKVEIQKLNIGAIFSIRKNGREYEYLGLCPIENVPCARSSSGEVAYFEPTDLVRPMRNYQIESK